MERAELIVPNTRNRLMYTYNLFCTMREKYKEQKYNFELLDYNDSGFDLVMNVHGFTIYPTDKERDSNYIFRIEETDQTNEWRYMIDSLLNDHEFLYCAGRDFVLEFGTHKNIDNRETVVHNCHDEVSEIDERFCEEWFFQQLTVQDMISFEDFVKEFDFIKSLYNSHIKEWDIIHIPYLKDFDLKLLEGFRVI